MFLVCKSILIHSLVIVILSYLAILQSDSDSDYESLFSSDLTVFPNDIHSCKHFMFNLQMIFGSFSCTGQWIQSCSEEQIYK